MTPETKCVETLVVTAVAAFIVITNKDMFFETRHVGKLLETRYGEVEEKRMMDQRKRTEFG